MSIAWDERFSIGDEELDADHREMMSLINALDTAAGCGEDVVAVIARLRDLCRDHFDREEALHRRLCFPDTDSLQLAHAMLLRRLDAILNHFADGCDQIRAGMMRTLGDSLATWMVFHISSADVNLRPFILAARRRGELRPGGAPPPPAGG